MYIDKLDNIVDKYNNASHKTIKMKPIDNKSSTYINFGAENNDEDPKFEVGCHEIISKHKHNFCNRLHTKLA